MSDRWLPVRAVLYGFVVGLIAFVALHLTLGRSMLATSAITGGAALALALIIRHVRRTQLMRTTQAQGYFASAVIISALALVMLPPGYVLGALN